jgi:hypothetical protein
MPHQLSGRVNTRLLDKTWTNFRAQKCILRLWEPIWHLQVTSRSFGEFHSFFVDPYGCWLPCLQEQRFREHFNAIKDRVAYELLRVYENIPNPDLKSNVFPIDMIIISHHLPHCAASFILYAGYSLFFVCTNLVSHNTMPWVAHPSSCI